MAAAIAGAFSLRLPAVMPLAAVCKSANAALTCCTAGWSAGEAEASALSSLALTSAIAVVNALTPSSVSLTCVRASRDDLSAATSAQAAVGVTVVGVTVGDAAVVAAGLVWLDWELAPQLVSMISRPTARTAAKPDRKARWSRIWVCSPGERSFRARYTPSQPIDGDQPTAGEPSR